MVAELKVTDLGLAAALICCEHAMLRTSSDGDGRVHFIFKETHAIKDDINAYWADSIRVKARKYFDTTKMLKSRIYANK